MPEIEISDLLGKLPAGYSVTHPHAATDTALLMTVDFLSAFKAAQDEYNVGQTTTGQDVNSLLVATGATQTVFYPPGQTTTSVEVRPKVYTFTTREEITVDDYLPIFI